MNKYLMKNRYEQVQVIGEEEMKQRIQKLRKIMEEKEVDLLLVLDGPWEGYSHWITGSRSVETVLIFQTGEIIAVYENK